LLWPRPPNPAAFRCFVQQLEELASTQVVEFQVTPQCRAAVSLRWPLGETAKVELQRLQPEAREDPMTEERLVLAELLEKAGAGDFLRAVA
jgi:hypothetical protein